MPDTAPRNRIETLWQGLIAGLLGYAVVAILVGGIDVARGRSFFYTAALLGEWLFGGLSDARQVTVWPGAVFAYNGLHLATFLVFGIIAAWLASLSERGHALWYAGLVLYILVLAHLEAAVWVMTEGIRAALPDYQVLIPGFVGATAMALYLLRVHPGLRRQMRHWEDDDERVPT